VKHYRRYLILLAAFVLLVLLMKGSRPKEIDWSPSFARAAKIPYGSYILFELLPDLFHGAAITTSDLPAYNALGGDEPIRGNYIVINRDFSPDDLDTRAILEFAAAGNSVFIAAADLDGPFADTLELRVEHRYLPVTGLVPTAEDSSSINFTSPALRAASDYHVAESFADSYFAEFDHTKATVLGIDAGGEPNFIRLREGAGAIYICTAPFLFTNYSMLRPGVEEYPYKALSYLPAGPVIWDDYYKEGRTMVRTPLRFIWSREALAWALYVGLAGVLLFIIFMGKRRERIIPEIRPLPNTTLEFVETVGRLYFQHGDHRNLAMKKITYFLDHIRTAYGVATGVRDEEFHRMLAARSGVDLEDVRRAFAYIGRIEEGGEIGEEGLAALNTAIEKFHRQSGRAPGRGPGSQA
jgi:hypothetical protein